MRTPNGCRARPPTVEDPALDYLREQNAGVGRVTGGALLFATTGPSACGRCPQITRLAVRATWFQFRGHHYYTAELTDAVHPGAPTGPLPGLARVAGHRGVYHRELPPRFVAVNSIQPMVARRTGRGWLVVESTAPLSQRLAVLAALSSS